MSDTETMGGIMLGNFRIPLLGHDKASYADPNVAELYDAQRRTLARAEEILAVNRVLQEDLRLARVQIAAYSHALMTAQTMIVAAEDREDAHPYHGPLSSDGTPIPDVVHERFHKSIGDVLTGNVTYKAREQMRKALNRPQPAPPQTTTTDKPLPKGAIGLQHQKIGIQLP